MAVVGDNRGQLNEKQMEISKKSQRRGDDADISIDIVEHYITEQIIR